MAKEMGESQDLKSIWALHPFAFTLHFKRQTFRKLQDVSWEATDAVKAILLYMWELKDQVPSIGTVIEEGDQIVAMGG